MPLPFITYGMKKKTNLTDFLTSGLSETVEIERNGRLWVSQVSGCARHGALAATYKGVGLDTASKEFYCEIGNTAEASILKGWNSSGILLFADYALPKIVNLNMGGKIDGIVVFENKIHIVEVKTCGNTMPSSPKKAHKSQAALYSAIVGFPYVIFYLSRNVANFNGDLKTKEFYFEFNKDELEINVFNAVYAQLCINEDVLPNKLIDKQNDLCSFCGFKDVCWEDGIPHLDVASTSKQRLLMSKARRRAKTIMNNDAIQKRRNGVLKHLSLHGNSNAKKLLQGTSWNELF